MNKSEVIKIMTSNLKGAMENNQLSGGNSIPTADIKSFGIIEKFDCVTSQVPKSTRNAVTGEFEPISDEDGKPVLQSITYPTVTGTVNGKAGSTIPLGAILRGQHFVGALNESQLCQLTETFKTERDLFFTTDTMGRKVLSLEKSEIGEAGETPTAAAAPTTRRRRNNAQG